LLAHELAHVFQQEGAEPVGQCGFAVGTEDCYERQAREIEQLAVWGEQSIAVHPVWMPRILRRQRAAVYRAVSTVCASPSDALVIAFDPVFAAVASGLFGILAEGLIDLDYLAKRPGKIFVDHYFDNPVTSSYIAFLASHNAHLRTPANIARLAILTNLPGGGIMRPDILTDQAGMKEYYEIKPDSAAGLALGLGKLAAIDAFMGTFRLPYSRGATYAPTSSIPIGSGTIPTLSGPVPFKATLSSKRTKAGLIQYQLCVETDFLAIGVTALVIIALIIVVIITKKLPGRLPPLPSPVPGSMPVLAP